MIAFLILFQSTAAACTCLSSAVFHWFLSICLSFLPTDLLWYDINVQYVSFKRYVLLQCFSETTQLGMARGLNTASPLLFCSALLLFDATVQWKQRHVIHLDSPKSVCLLKCEMESHVHFSNDKHIFLWPPFHLDNSWVFFFCLNFLITVSKI